ncbi:hypothetical protein ACIRTB_21190 [Streptomyces sp. NPDC101158]|uniref:hypothetical protein n=1 Tax=Streptomyces sp. NPDC101158 TaxID=3366117 RepID=UPI00380EE86F
MAIGVPRADTPEEPQRGDAPLADEPVLLKDGFRTNAGSREDSYQLLLNTHYGVADPGCLGEKATPGSSGNVDAASLLLEVENPAMPA